MRKNFFKSFFASIPICLIIMANIASAEELNLVYVGNNPSMSDIECDINSIRILNAKKSLVSVDLLGVFNDEASNRFANNLNLNSKPYATVNTMVINYSNLTFTISSSVLIDEDFNILYTIDNGLNGTWDKVGKSGYIYNTACKVFDVLKNSN